IHAGAAGIAPERLRDGRFLLVSRDHQYRLDPRRERPQPSGGHHQLAAVAILVGEHRVSTSEIRVYERRDVILEAVGSLSVELWLLLKEPGARLGGAEDPGWIVGRPMAIERLG